MYEHQGLFKKATIIGGDEAQLSICCPFHNDNNPSAVYFCNDGHVFCFVCGYHRREELELILGRELEQLEDPFFKIISNEEKEEIKRLETIRFQTLKLALDNDYIKMRGYDNEVVKRFYILEDTDGIVFPVKDKNSKIVAYQKRHYHKEPKYMNYGIAQPLWGMERLKEARNEEVVYFCEGIFGALNGIVHYNKPVFAVLGLEKFLNKVDMFYNMFNKVVCILDDDEAGKKVALKLERIKKPNMEIINFDPDGTEWTNL